MIGLRPEGPGRRAAAEGDVHAVADRMADDIVWHVSGRNPLSGDHRGKRDVLGYLTKLAEETGGTLKNEPHDVLANDEHAVGLLTFSAQRVNRTLHERAAHVTHVRDGKLAEVRMFWEDQRVVDEFSSSPLSGPHPGELRSTFSTGSISAAT